MEPASTRAFRLAGNTHPVPVHAALVLAALAVGESLISAAGDDPALQATARALRAFGADLTVQGGDWRVRGVGIGGLAEPAAPIDLTDAPAALPLILGLAAGHPITCFVTGRPDPAQARLIEPLQRHGARFLLRDDHALPLGVAGARHPLPQDHRLTMPAPDVRAAILLAGLNAPGITRIIEPAAGDGTIEALLGHFGAEVRRYAADGAHVVELTGQPELAPRQIALAAP